MKALELPPPSETELAALHELYHTTKDVRLRTRAQMILLVVEHQMKAGEVAAIVLSNEETVRRWMKRYGAEGLEGLKDKPRPGASPKVSPAYAAQLLAAVRRRPRSLGCPFSLWTLQRLADYLAEETGLRVSDETVRLQLAKHEIVLSRPQHKISSPDPEYEVKKRRLKSPEAS